MLDRFWWITAPSNRRMVNIISPLVSETTTSDWLRSPNQTRTPEHRIQSHTHHFTYLDWRAHIRWARWKLCRLSSTGRNKNAETNVENNSLSCFFNNYFKWKMHVECSDRSDVALTVVYFGFHAVMLIRSTFFVHLFATTDARNVIRR